MQEAHDAPKVLLKMLRQFAALFAVSEVTHLAITTFLLAVGPAQASDQPLPSIRGTWEFPLSEIHFSEDPLVITRTRITMRNRSEFIFAALCRCNGGQVGTVLYKLKNGRWERQHLC